MAHAAAVTANEIGSTVSSTAAAADGAGDRTAHEALPVEAELLQRYAGGDDAAMDELMLMYQRQAFWVARHLVHHDEMANDIVQDAFVRLLRHHERFDHQRSSFRAWFLQIVRNMAIDHLRKARLRVSQDLVESADTTTRMDRVERTELRGQIDGVLAAIPEPYNELIRLRDIEGISPQEIAVITDTDYGTTRWRIHNARKLFRKEWQSRYGDDLP